MGEHCSSTEFSSTAETASQKLFEIVIHFNFKAKTKVARLRELPPKSNNPGRKEKIHHRRLNHRHSL